MSQYSLDDMLKRVSSFSYERKMAIAFAVYSGLTLEQVINLKWSDEVSLCWRAELILGRAEMSDSTDYVFWELANGIASRMNSLPFMFDVFNLWGDWGLFSSKYKDSIPIMFDYA